MLLVLVRGCAMAPVVIGNKSEVAIARRKEPLLHPCTDQPQFRPNNSINMTFLLRHTSIITHSLRRNMNIHWTITSEQQLVILMHAL